jgi:hypothetical protein
MKVRFIIILLTSLLGFYAHFQVILENESYLDTFGVPHAIEATEHSESSVEEEDEQADFISLFFFEQFQEGQNILNLRPSCLFSLLEDIPPEHI